MNVGVWGVFWVCFCFLENLKFLMFPCSTSTSRSEAVDQK